MITQEQQKYQKVLSIIAGAMLLLAIPDIWPYGYFQILRWVVAIVAGFNAYIAYKIDKKSWLWIMVATAILFNPITPIHLTKEVWIVIDIIVAVLFFASLKYIKI